MKMRHLEVQGLDWSYYVGRTAAVLQAPNGHKTVVHLHVLTGRSPDIIERGQYKGTSDGMVQPAVIRAYIAKHWQELLLPRPTVGKRRMAVVTAGTWPGGVAAEKVSSPVLEALIELGFVVKKGKAVFTTELGQSILRRVGSPRARA